MSSRSSSPTARLAIAFATLAVAAASSAAAPEKNVTPSASSTGRVVCSTPIQHPLDVRVEALGPIRRGEPLAIRVTTSTVKGIDRGEVRLASSGGTAVVGDWRAVLRAVPAGGQTTSRFTVVVPKQGHRFVVQFKVHAEGNDLKLTRGAVLNLLPDGPAETLTAATTATGEKILEARARRIER